MSLIPLFRFFVGLGIIFKKIRVIGYSKFKIIIIICFSVSMEPSGGRTL